MMIIMLGGKERRVDDPHRLLEPGVQCRTSDELLIESIHLPDKLHPRLAELGEGFYQDLLEVYERGGELSLTHETALREVIREQVRYVIFAQIDEDFISRREKESVQGKKDEVKKDVLDMITSRRMSTEFMVYDVYEGRRVWRGHLAGARSNKNRYVSEQKDLENEQDLLEVIVGVILDVDSPEPVYPPPPTTTSVLAGIFKNFAKSLPEPGKVYTAQK